jgi:hypothetical protein
MQNQNQLEVKDVILDIALLKRRKQTLSRELQAIQNEIEQKENFLYDSFQNEAIQLAREARDKHLASQEVSKK